MRLIDADELLKSPRTYRNIVDCSIGEEYILKAPTIDAKPIIHARWIRDKFKDYCSNCGYDYGDCYNLVGVKYCYHCGAKMDLEK